jgi:hypothetical protein
MKETHDTPDVLRAALKKEGLDVPEDEFEQMVGMYELMLGNMQSLYFDEVRYESPALIYEAQPS